jgi:hypothetical protein
VAAAYVPTEHFVTVADFVQAMPAGRMALGWIGLRR